MYGVNDAGGFNAVADVDDVEGGVDEFVAFFNKGFGTNSDEAGVCFDPVGNDVIAQKYLQKILCNNRQTYLYHGMMKKTKKGRNLL